MTLIEYRLSREMWNGSQWIEEHSVPLADLDRVKSLLAELDRERPQNPVVGEFGHCWYEQRKVAPWIRP